MFRCQAVISWDGLHFGASDLQVCWSDVAWQVQHFVWPGVIFSWQAQYLREMEWTNRKTHWYEDVSSAVDFPFWWRSRRIASFLKLSTWKMEEVSQNCFVSEHQHTTLHYTTLDDSYNYHCHYNYSYYHYNYNYHSHCHYNCSYNHYHYHYNYIRLHYTVLQLHYNYNYITTTSATTTTTSTTTTTIATTATATLQLHCN